MLFYVGATINAMLKYQHIQRRQKRLGGFSRNEKLKRGTKHVHMGASTYSTQNNWKRACLCVCACSISLFSI